MKIKAQLRKLMLADTRTAREIEKATGIHWASLYGFKRGERSLPDDALEKLAAAYGMEIVLRNVPKRRKP